MKKYIGIVAGIVLVGGLVVGVGVKYKKPLLGLMSTRPPANVVDARMIRTESVDLQSQPVTELQTMGTEETITEINCSKTYITQLNVDNSKVLTTIDVSSTPIAILSAKNCPQLRCLNLDSCAKLVELSISNCPAYAEMSLRDWNIRTMTKLDVSDCTSMWNVRCSDNPLTYLSLKGLQSVLANLECSSTKLATLKVEGFTVLQGIYASNNTFTVFSAKNCDQVTKIDLNKCSKLVDVNLKGCKSLTEIEIDAPLAKLDISGCTAMNRLVAKNGNLTQQNVDDILDTLTANGELFDGICDLSGGKSATPSAIGLAKKAQLQSRYWIVKTN